MKKALFFFLIICVATPGFAFVKSFGPEYDAVVTIFQGEEEPDAMDAVWKTETLLRIGVFKHGNNYDEYASHACNIIEKNSFEGKTVTIQIIDLKKLAETEEWVVLGQAQCK
ncbi:MAG: hypothetical protein GQ563_05430 [Desulfuromusa sp.]|nr:hypothetical protein [Desulfuromusa sp.]